MRNNAKRVLSIALALFMCLGMLTCIVLPVSAAETSYPEVWEEYGLAPTGSETYVDLTTQTIACARPNITNTTESTRRFMAAAPDWSVYAYKDYDATTGTLSNQYTSVSNANPEIKDADKVLDVGEEFYAKMPTTGIVYKLTYGDTAANSKWCNTYVCATILLFPGEYTYFFYESSGDYHTKSQYGNTRASGDTSQMVLGYYNAQVRVIGPQAGVSAANASDGTVANNRVYTDTANEAYFSKKSSYIYVRNHLFDDGANLIIDGISGGGDWYMSTNAGNGAYWFEKTYAGNVFTINVKNCLFDEIKKHTRSNTTDGLFELNAYGSTVGNGNDWETEANMLNMAYACGNLKIENTYYSTEYRSNVNLDSIQINNSVIKTTETMGVFRINPSRGDFNTAKIDLNYSLKNSYYEGTKGFFYGVYTNATANLEDSRTGIVTEFENNKIVNLGMEDTDGTRGALYYEFSTTSPTRGQETITALATKKRVLTVKNNVFLNNTGAEKTSKLVNVIGILSAGTENADISRNTFIGYNAGGLFNAISSECDVSNNVFIAADQSTIVSGKVKSGTVSDIVLDKDFKVYASDFKITEGVNKTSLTWTNKGTDAWADLNTEGNATAEIPYVESATADVLMDTFAFASAKVSAVSLNYWDGSAIGENDTFDADTTVFALTLKHGDSDNTLTYKVNFSCTHKTINPDTAEGSYLAPTCGTAGYQKGICANCLESVTVELQATGEHNWVLNEIIEEVTCSHAGENKYVCTNDDCMKDGQAVKYETVDPLPHTPRAEVVAYEGKQATCKAAGEGYIDCVVCKQILQENIVIEQLNSHVIAQSVTVVQQPTCIAVGSGYYECIYCRNSVTATLTLPANGVHTGGQWVVTQQPTLLKQGVETSFCIHCGEVVEMRAIDALEGEAVADTFTDLSDKDWYVANGAVSYVYNAGLFKGTTATSFSPKASMTRGMFVTVLGRLHGVTSTNGSTKFTDVNSGKYYAPFVKWANENGIVNGATATTFAPDSNITREQICVMLLRYCEYAKITLNDISSAYAFTDQDSISAYAKEAVVACQIAGIVSGEATNNGYRFRPQGTATRAEVATILMNFAYNHL